MDIVGAVTVDGRPVAGVAVVATDEGRPVGSALADPEGRFVLIGLPDAGAVTLRAVDPSAGAGTLVVTLPAADPVALTLSPRDCQLYVDLVEPRWLVTPAFLDSWDQPPLAPTCEDCPTYRWFWDRPGQAGVVLRLDFTPDGLRSTVRIRTAVGWDEIVRDVSGRRARQIDAALGLSGFWQLEHASTAEGCDPTGSEWTVEAVASPGYRAVYRVRPYGTPLGWLGTRWVKAVGLKAKRKELQR